MTPEEYEAKRQAKIDRLNAAASRKAAEAETAAEQAIKMGQAIPMGQPILIGHYSEQRDRNYRERIDRKIEKSVSLHHEAEELARRAEAAANNTAIFSDDPAAAEKLEDKIARLEQRQALMIAANKLVRKNDRAGLAGLGFSETRITKLFMPDFCGRTGFPDYAIKNNSANIRRLKERLGTVQKLAEAREQGETRTTEINGVRIVDDPEANRTQVYFPGKPSEAIRSMLKSRGFRWAPSAGCWQRNMSNQARYEAERIAQQAA